MKNILKIVTVPCIKSWGFSFGRKMTYSGVTGEAFIESFVFLHCPDKKRPNGLILALI